MPRYDDTFVDRFLEPWNRHDVDGDQLSRLVRRIRVRRRRGLCNAHHSLHVSRVIKEDTVAVAHRLKMFLRERISHAAPRRAAIAHEVVKTVVSRFFFDQPVHDYSPERAEAAERR